jgi:hypothetical protein
MAEMEGCIVDVPASFHLRGSVVMGGNYLTWLILCLVSYISSNYRIIIGDYPAGVPRQATTSPISLPDLGISFAMCTGKVALLSLNLD